MARLLQTFSIGLWAFGAVLQQLAGLGVETDVFARHHKGCPSRSDISRWIIVGNDRTLLLRRPGEFDKFVHGSGL
jgi:hypothetical protein